MLGNYFENADFYCLPAILTGGGSFLLAPNGLEVNRNLFLSELKFKTSLIFRFFKSYGLYHGMLPNRLLCFLMDPSDFSPAGAYEANPSRILPGHKGLETIRVRRPVSCLLSFHPLSLF